MGKATLIRKTPSVQPNPAPEPRVHPSRREDMPHYTVVEVKKKSFIGKRLRAPDLQQAINEHAHKGLTLDRIVSGETARHLVGSRDVFLLIFREEYAPPS